MAIVDVVVIPVGTDGPSVSKYIAEIQTKLKEYKAQGKIDYQLTPMNTLIEGDLKDLFEVVQAIHELPFDKGLDRVCTNIRIDDRRDKSRKMNDKVKAVQNHLENGGH
ncbi:MTH1187 family thiamine-binding protein [Staphylococcus equorum]